ncbi:hypothetical protein [Streptomyces sp. NPDC046859]|uniref:hypothetical protein n=1 Tax=Streptomyces sp. NPDC046859 TaxID=3155734 RepID=UPI0033CF6E12
MKGPGGRWCTLDSRLLLRDVVAASELFNQRALELVCSALGLATEEVEVTPGQRPVMRMNWFRNSCRSSGVTVRYSSRGRTLRRRAMKAR